MQTAGSYTIRYRVASTGTSGQVQLRSGSTILATTNVPNTGGWQNWTTITATANLTVGDQTLRLHFSGGGFNLNWFEAVQAAPPAGTIANGIYRINSVLSNKALDVASASTANGAAVQQWDWANGNNQKWNIQSLGDGLYRVTAVHSNKVLDVSGVSTADGAQLHQWDWANGNNQKWRIEDTGSGLYRFTALHSNKVMHIGSTANGARVVQQPWNNTNNQKWRLELLQATTASLKAEPLISLEGIEIYPNPVEKTLFINNSKELKSIEIFTLNGMLTKTYNQMDFRYGEIDVQNLKNGVYFIKLFENEGNVKTLKFIKM